MIRSGLAVDNIMCVLAQHCDDSRFSVLAQDCPSFRLSTLEGTFIKTFKSPSLPSANKKDLCIG